MVAGRFVNVEEMHLQPYFILAQPFERVKWVCYVNILAFYRAGIKRMQTGDGTLVTWPVGVRLPLR